MLVSRAGALLMIACGMACGGVPSDYQPGSPSPTTTPASTPSPAPSPGPSNPSIGVPTIHGIALSPSTPALMAVTPVTFVADASHSGGRSLTYRWDFGDGTSGQGRTATHTYTRRGTFSATLTVSDGLTEAQDRVSVQVKDLSGTWDGIYNDGFGVTFRLSLVQSGTTLLGEYSDPDIGSATVIDSELSAPRSVAFRIATPQQRLIVAFSGTAEPSLDRVSGSAWSGTSSFRITRR